MPSLSRLSRDLSYIILMTQKARAHCFTHEWLDRLPWIFPMILFFLGLCMLTSRVRHLRVVTSTKWINSIRTRNVFFCCRWHDSPRGLSPKCSLLVVRTSCCSCSPGRPKLNPVNLKPSKIIASNLTYLITLARTFDQYVKICSNRWGGFRSPSVWNVRADFFLFLVCFSACLNRSADFHISLSVRLTCQVMHNSNCKFLSGVSVTLNHN